MQKLTRRRYEKFGRSQIMISRRNFTQLGLAASMAATFGVSPRRASAALLEGKPFAGQAINIMLPQSSQFRAHEKAACAI
jgi:hypothetical protein